MKTTSVIIAVGRPGSGKTTTSDKLAARGVIKANVLHVEDYLQANNEHVRDIYGNNMLRLDTWDIFWRHVKDLLHQYRGVLVIEMWLPKAEERAEAISRLRTMGVEKVICWHFVTPPDLCRSRYINRMLAEYPDGHRWLGSHWDFLNRGFEPVAPEEVTAFVEPSALDRRCFNELFELSTAWSSTSGSTNTG